MEIEMEIDMEEIDHAQSGDEQKRAAATCSQTPKHRSSGRW